MLSWDLPPHSTDTRPGTEGHIALLTEGLQALMLRLVFIPHLTSYFAKKLYFIVVYRFSVKGEICVNFVYIFVLC